MRGLVQLGDMTAGQRPEARVIEIAGRLGGRELGLPKRGDLLITKPVLRPNNEMIYEHYLT